MTTPRTSGTGNVRGTLTTTDVFPALVKRSGQVGARIERDETGSLRLAPGLYSRMSKTSQSAPSQPMTRALFAMRAEGYRGPTRGSPVPLSDWRRSRLALREPLDGLPQSLG